MPTTQPDTRPPATRADCLRAAVAYATLAPSSHNAQPWRFRVVDDVLELCADRSRRLPVVDPDDRELLIGCGAALLNLRLALRHFGWTDDVETLPDADRPDLLARVRAGEPRAISAEDDALFRAIPRRHTDRRPFEERAVGPVLVAALQAAARAEGGALDVAATHGERVVIASLVAEADRRQARDPAFRRELAAWLHANDSLAHDGMPGAAHGFGDVASVVAPFVVRQFDWGRTRAPKDHALAMSAPLLAVLATADDGRASWLQAGQALARTLLTATAVGLSASFLNGPVELPELRADVARVLGLNDVPQLVLRVGYAPPVEDETSATPRRTAAEVLVT